MDTGDIAPGNGSEPYWTQLTEGEWAGWAYLMNGDPFEDFAGPFYRRQEADGGVVSAFRTQQRHANAKGLVSEGALLTFLDYALFSIASPHYNGPSVVTVSVQTDFLGSTPVGGILTSRGDLLKAEGSTMVVRGTIDAAGDLLMGFMGVVKAVGERSHVPTR